MNALERRTRWMLRAYPPSWRYERGQEMVGTILDLSEDGQSWPAPGLALDVLLGGWSERARRHRRMMGSWLAAGWRLATIAAVVLQVSVALAWLWKWAAGDFVAMLPVLGAASEVTYVSTLLGFVVATTAWLSGRVVVARSAATAAIVSWAITVFIFQIGLAGGTPNRLILIAWTYLAVLATWGLWRPPPQYRLGVGLPAASLAVAAILWTSAGHRASLGLLSPFDLPFNGGGTEALAVLVAIGWALTAVIALLVAHRDPRPIIAAALFVPLVVLAHPPVLSAPFAMTMAVLSLVALSAAASTPRMVDRARW